MQGVTISFRIGHLSQFFLGECAGSDPKKTLRAAQECPPLFSIISKVLLVLRKYYLELTLVFEETGKGDTESF